MSNLAPWIVLAVIAFCLLMLLCAAADNPPTPQPPEPGHDPLPDVNCRPLHLVNGEEPLDPDYDPRRSLYPTKLVRSQAVRRVA